MKRHFSVSDRRKCETPYQSNLLPPLPSPLTACCWFPASLLSATPTADSCLNPNGPPAPKAPAHPHNNSFINSALKSGAEASALIISPASRPTCPPPRSRRNVLSLSLLPSVMPMAENQRAKAERGASAPLVMVAELTVIAHLAQVFRQCTAVARIERIVAHHFLDVVDSLV